MERMVWRDGGDPSRYLGALYCRLAMRREKSAQYQYLGPEHFDRIDREVVLPRSVRRLERLGYQVTVERLAASEFK